jgi:hypothetical protein
MNFCFGKGASDQCFLYLSLMISCLLSQQDCMISVLKANFVLILPRVSTHEAFSDNFPSYMMIQSGSNKRLIHSKFQRGK